MIINRTMENIAHTQTIRGEQKSSLRLVHGNMTGSMADTVSISVEARECHEMSGESALVKAVCAVCPGSADLAREIEAAYDRERAEKVRKVKAILTGEDDGYDSGSDAA